MPVHRKNPPRTCWILPGPWWGQTRQTRETWQTTDSDKTFPIDLDQPVDVFLLSDRELPVLWKLQEEVGYRDAY